MSNLNKQTSTVKYNNLLSQGWFEISDKNNPITFSEDCLIRLEDGQIRRYSEDWEDENLLVTHWKPIWKYP
jgi:hypothetical protein